MRLILCYVTDRHALPASPESGPLTALTRKIAEAAQAGIDWIQIREKDLSAKELAAVTREALRAAQWHRLQPVKVSKSGASHQNASPVLPRTRIIVNDRLDIALAERAAGVHLGEHSIPPAEARRLVQSAQKKGSIDQDFLIGVSCHSLAAAKSAAAAGAGYIIFGPIFPTPSKSQYGAPQGLDRLAEICRAVSIPVLAIGGITLANAASCLQAGASGIAAIRLFQDSPDSASVMERCARIAEG
jgi:thiamine-phosphate pyrophosphorylase